MRGTKLFVGALATVLLARVPVAAQQIPPPPPENHYDPIPGPYFVGPADIETASGSELLDRIAEGWVGPRLSAFSLCVHPGTTPPGNDASWIVLNRVAAELHRRGAEIVLIEPFYRCPGLPPPKLEGHTVIEIRGLLRPRPIR